MIKKSFLTAVALIIVTAAINAQSVYLRGGYRIFITCSNCLVGRKLPS
jgi:hypothetical protein